MHLSAHHIMKHKRVLDAEVCEHRTARRKAHSVEWQKQELLRQSLRPLLRKLRLSSGVMAWDKYERDLMRNMDADSPMRYWVFLYRPGLFKQSVSGYESVFSKVARRYVVAIREHESGAHEVVGLDYCVDYYRDYPRDVKLIGGDGAVEYIEKLIAENMGLPSC